MNRGSEDWWKEYDRAHDFKGCPTCEICQEPIQDEDLIHYDLDGINAKYHIGCFMDQFKRMNGGY